MADILDALGVVLPPGTYSVTANVVNALGTQVAQRMLPASRRVVTNVTASLAWRRRYRKYCHWLARQQVNFTTSGGIFSGVGLNPVLTTAEAAILAVVYGQLYTTDGYRPGSPAIGLPITPP